MEKIIFILIFTLSGFLLLGQTTPNSFYRLNNSDEDLRRMDFEQALNKIDEILANNENSAIAYGQRAFIKSKMGLYNEARQDIEKARKLNPMVIDLFGLNGLNGLRNIVMSNPNLDFELIQESSLFSMYQKFIDDEYSLYTFNEEELSLLQKILEEIENNEPPQIILEDLDSVITVATNTAIFYDLKGLVLLRSNNLLEAKKCFSKAVTENPSFAIGWYNLAQVEKELGNLETATEYFNKAILLENELTIAKFDLAILSKKNGAYDEAIKLYNEIIENDINYKFEALKNRGLTRKGLGDFTRATIDIDKAIQLDPMDEKLIFYRANLHLLFGDFTDAINDYSKVLQLDESNSEAYYNRALAYIRIHDHYKACLDFAKYAELNGSEDKTLQLFCADL